MFYHFSKCCCCVVVNCRQLLEHNAVVIIRRSVHKRVSVIPQTTVRAECPRSGHDLVGEETLEETKVVVTPPPPAEDVDSLDIRIRVFACKINFLIVIIHDPVFHPDPLTLGEEFEI